MLFAKGFAGDLQSRTAARRTFRRTAAGQRLNEPPDLQTQLESLLNEVWKQEAFERQHPLTCGVIREGSSRAWRDR